MTPYLDFINRLELVIRKHPQLIVTTLSNIFTMRLIGNKTHGDLAEIAISEFINQYMYDFKSIHVGKDLYRAKSKEEDISVTNELTGEEFPISLKAYGDGPLQLSTDKNFSMFPLLESYGEVISDKNIINEIFSNDVFKSYSEINVLPLIYDEKRQRCNIMVFNPELAKSNTVVIRKASSGSGRKHPAYRFYDSDGNYVCEVRYGNAAANALQRGMWTHTKNAQPYFRSLTGGWVDYSHNELLIRLFSTALVASDTGHLKALQAIESDIANIKMDNDIKSS